MKRLTFTAFFCFLACLLGFTAAFGQQQFLPNQLVFKVKPELAAACEPNDVRLPEIHKILNGFGAYTLETKFKTRTLSKNRAVNLSQIYLVRFQNNAEIELATKALAKCQALAYAEPLYVYEPYNTVTPNDPQFINQWGLAKIKAPEGWFIHQGDTAVKIGIIDTGIQWDHEDLLGNLAYNYNDPINGLDDDGDGYIDNFRGWDFAAGTGGAQDNDTRPSSALTNTHGTQVAGVAAAATDNNLGVAGAGFKCRFMPVKTTPDSGSMGGLLTNAYDGVKYAADMGCAVINCSFGTCSSCTPVYSQYEQDIVSYAFDNGSLVVAAGGNGSIQKTVYPAAYDKVLGVAGSNLVDNVTTIYGYHIDLCAPGGVVTTNYNNVYVTSANVFSSYATPMASGAAAIVKAKYPAYSPEQVGERLRVTADDVYALHDTSIFWGKIGKGRLNLYRALTENSPAVRMRTYSATDGNNNVLEPGETVNFIGQFINYLDPTANLVVTAVTDADPYVTVAAGTANFGVMTTFQTKYNTNTPFQLQISPAVPFNYTFNLRLEYKDGAYTDFQYVTLVINPTYVNIDVAKLQTSFSFFGEWGSANAPQAPKQGLGIRYNGKDFHYEAGVLIGNAKDRVHNNFRTSQGAQDADFYPIEKAQGFKPGTLSDQDGTAAFNDSLAANPYNIDVRMKTYAFGQAPYNDFVIFRYSIKNRNLFALPNMHFGLMADLDFTGASGSASNDSAAYDPDLQMTYAWGEDDGTENNYIGIVALSATAATLNARNGYPDPANSLAFTDSAKYQAISQGVGVTTVNNQDVIVYIGEGGMGIPPLDSVFTAYAIVGGQGLENLKANAAKARQKYTCMFNAPISVNLGADTTACGSVTLNGATLGAASYLWSNNSAQPVITVSQTGTYTLTAIDANGCSAQDAIQVNIVPTVSPNYTLSDTVLRIGDVTDTLFVADATPGAVSVDWNFGDGFGSFSPAAQHVYTEPGTYTVTLVVSNGLCSDTVRRTIVVETFVGRNDAFSRSFTLAPNPATGFVDLLTTENGLQIRSAAVVNALGQRYPLAFTQNGAAARFSLDGLPAGIYLFEAETSQGKWTGKVAVLKGK